MAGAIIRYFDNPGSARDHGRAARQTALQRFSLERMVGDYLSLYDSLLAQGHAPRAHVRASGL
jgi:glycosyltransferase involved in cell wall biosynthesis